MSRSPYDAVIIGAGIVGSACGLEFARAGLRTAIIEASVIGGGTTAAGMGHLVVMDDSPAQLALTKYSLELWSELADELPRAVEFDRCGTIWVASDDEELAAAHKKKQLYDAHGVDSEIVDCNVLETAEPNLKKGLAGGLLVERDSVLYPPLAAVYLVEQAVSLGANLHRCAAIEITSRGVRLADGSLIDAGAIVNAAGVFAPALTPALPLRRRKGHLVITDRYPGWAKHQLVELGYLKSAHSDTSDSVAFNVQPRMTGQLLIGSSRQFGVDDAGVDDVILSRMIQRACEYMPGLKDLSAIRVWTGFRPATADNLPLIGRWPGQRNLYIAAGHEGLGITTSLGTARILADQVLGRPSTLLVTPYLPSRLATEALTVEVDR